LNIKPGHYYPGKDPMIDADATYETLMARLTAVVDRLETGTLPLAEALALYEEGVALGAACERLLEQAELRVRSLSASEAGVGVEDWDEAQPLGDR
jgi:exodeoxyribonuclease VII small subunit